MKPKRITLTDRQANDLLWAAHTALDQLGKFLRHDNWDEQLTARERRDALRIDRKLARIAKTLEKKIV